MVSRTDRVRRSLFSRFVSDTTGATAIEYSFLTFIGFAIAATIVSTGESLLAIWDSIAEPFGG